jgi:hypothetical protein
VKEKKDIHTQLETTDSNQLKQVKKLHGKDWNAWWHLFLVK